LRRHVSTDFTMDRWLDEQDAFPEDVVPYSAIHLSWSYDAGGARRGAPAAAPAPQP
jgi:hypothetical protein